MAQAPNIDGILITWGDRLFYPGNRVVKTKPQPRLSGDAARLRAAAIRKRIEATVVRRAPQVMVKVTGGGRGMNAIAAHFRYISKNGRLEIEDQRGETMRGIGTVGGRVRVVVVVPAAGSPSDEVPVIEHGRERGRVGHRIDATQPAARTTQVLPGQSGSPGLAMSEHLPRAPRTSTTPGAFRHGSRLSRPGRPHSHNEQPAASHRGLDVPRHLARPSG